MSPSIKNKIYLSFFLLVFLFIINGIVSIVTLNNNKKLSQNISDIITPTLEETGNFEDLLIQSKICTTNWVFLRSDQEDKDALKKLQDTDYPAMKLQLNLLLSKLNEKEITD